MSKRPNQRDQQKLPERITTMRGITIERIYLNDEKRNVDPLVKILLLASGGQSETGDQSTKRLFENASSAER